MATSRRKTFNSVNAASLARWIVITGSLALTGLIYVYLSLQLHDLGDRKKALENELTNLRSENEVTSAQIAALTSRSARSSLHSPTADWLTRSQAPFCDRPNRVTATRGTHKSARLKRETQ